MDLPGSATQADSEQPSTIKFQDVEAWRKVKRLGCDSQPPAPLPPATTASANSSWIKEGALIAEAAAPVKSQVVDPSADALESRVTASEAIQEQAKEKRVVEDMSTRVVGAAAGPT